LGDEVFFRILRTYAARYRDGNAGTGDFIALAQAVSQRDLQDFFAGWLYAPQVPAIPELGLAASP
jgi:aminopeptidase N